MKRLKGVAAVLLLLCVLTGCEQDTHNSVPPRPETPAPTAAGDTFLSSGFKIRSEIKPKSSVSSDPIIFEVYVDGQGNGSGLVGYRDNVYDVYLVGREVYVVVTDGTAVHVTDLTAHMYPTSVSVTGAGDLKSLGFSMISDSVVNYTGGNDSVDMVSQYEKSISTFEPVAISQSNNMTCVELLKYFFDNANAGFVEPNVSESIPPERTSFYVNSAFGVTIHDTVYSLGDFCEPYTYFEGMIPQGINTNSGYREDEKVIFTYVSYLSRDGSSTFMMTDGYVQAISTTSDFTFLEVITRGMDSQELERLLGIGLKKDEIEEFVPIREGLIAEKSRSGLTCTYGDMTIELEVDSKTKTLAAITITNYLDFRS